MNKFNFREYSYDYRNARRDNPCYLPDKPGTKELIELLTHMAHDRINILEVKKQLEPPYFPQDRKEEPDKPIYIIQLEVQYTPFTPQGPMYRKPLWRKITYVWDATSADYSTALAYGYYLALEMRKRLEASDAGLEQAELGE